ATSILLDAEDGKSDLSIERLNESALAGSLVELVRAYSQDRLDEGYERGIHDTDAALILEKLISLRASAGLLRFSADARALAVLWFSSLASDASRVLRARARSLGRLRQETQHAAAQAALARELEAPIAAYATSLGLSPSQGEVASGARYLVLDLEQERVRLVASAVADGLRRELTTFLDEAGSRRAFEDELRALEGHMPERFGVALAYMEAFVTSTKREHARPFIREAAVILVTDASSGRSGIEREPSAATVETEVTGLLGSHPRIHNRTMHLAIDEVLSRLMPFIGEAAPRFRAFRKLKADIVERERKRLRMSEFSPRVLTSFVRNRLIDQVYLPLVGANLAKQIGTVGAKKRTDLMGMLLLVSPPGYGKTTLMEYIASKLGLVFMKVNGPALGHDVTSLDPNEAKSGTARQEVEKINLAFEMGNNVMLYLDDIQHTSSELLQKFISLCDGQRRIEGVWKGRTRTYDLRGKKFCVVMAGNPYTESGARFQIPDMLANRADTYNLGDILGGQEALFASSYIENALTSNATLATLATRDPADVQKLVRMASGEDIPLTELSHGYSAAEVEEILGVLKRLMKVQSLLLKVNQEYIRSASQEDAYRTEPPFKLQGSYRNMNKLAEKVVAAMNDAEIEQLIDDHYASESQTLTTGAEQNLLKLAELRGRMTDEQRARYKEIKDAFVRTGRAGKKGDDPVSRVTGALSGVDEQLQRIRESISHATVAMTSAAPQPADGAGLAPVLEKLQHALRPLGKAPKVDLRIDDGSAAAAVAVVNVVREQTAVFERVVSSLVELANRGQLARDGMQLGSSASPPRGPLDAHVEELTSLMKRLDQRLSTLATELPRFSVTLDSSSPSTFWRSMDGNDVVRHGGVFVATYAKLPPLGAMLALGLEFPGGVRADVQAQVCFIQEHLGDDTPAGFGAKLLAPPPDVTAMIAQFVRYREPLVRE
ncbi:MAG TPA: AAA family ATPase, partial [Labilithrix sp.]|nr:AAA family ATPase [Labilithrix sp.]